MPRASRTARRVGRARWAACGLPVGAVLAVLATGAFADGVEPACPSRAPRQIHSDSWSAAHRELAPVRAHTTINLCRYSGMNSQPAFKLQARRFVASSSTVRRLVHRFDAIKSFPRSQAFGCPADDGSEVLAVLFYSNHRTVEISTALTGCNAVTNGDLRRTATNFDNRNPQGPKLLAQLERLTRR